MNYKKNILMIAGPNGSGKTTTAKSIFSDHLNIYEFINADEIARGLAPIHPASVSLSASKLMIKRFTELLNTNKSFAFETTGSGTNYIRHLKEARTKGYELSLMFLWLSSPDLAIERVAIRVAQGGHHVPEGTIKRRYYAGLKNLVKSYLPLCDSALILDNSMTTSTSVIARKNLANVLKVEIPNIWKEIEGVANAKQKQY